MAPASTSSPSPRRPCPRCSRPRPSPTPPPPRRPPPSACSAARSIPEQARPPPTTCCSRPRRPPSRRPGSRTVDAHHPGAGRRVLPSLHHLLLFAAAHPEPYLNAQLGVFFELAGNPGNGFRRSLEDLHALIDVPAELVLQSLRDVFHTPRLFDGGFCHEGGRPLRPAAIRTTALLTIEAAADALVGPGQTHAAHTLTPALADTHRARLTLEGAAHYDLFTGPLMTAEVAPTLRSFMTAFDRF